MVVEWLQKALYPKQWEQRETRIQQREGTGRQEIMKQKLANLQEKAQLAYQMGGPDAFRSVMSEGLPQIDPNLAKIFQQGQVQPGAPLFQQPPAPLDPLEQAREKHLRTQTEALPAEAERAALKEIREADKWKEAKKEAGEERQADAWSKFFDLQRQPGREMAAMRGEQLTPMMGLDKPYSAQHLMGLGPQVPRAGGQLPTVPGMGMGYKFGPMGALTEVETIPESTYKPGIIEKTSTGDQQPYSYGDPIPKGWKIVREAQTQITIGAPTKPASASERTSIAELRASKDALTNLEKLYKDEYVGVVTGRVAPTLGLFGKTAEQQENFMAATTAFKNAIIKQITGAQMSEQEADRIMKQVPDITDPPARWKAKYQQSLKNVERVYQRKMEVLRQSGITVPMDVEQIDIQSMSDEELLRIAGGR